MGTTGLSTYAISPTISFKDIENISMTLADTPKENIYTNVSVYKMLELAIKNSINGVQYQMLGVQVFKDDCVPDNMFFLCSVEDFELYKYLKKHPMFYSEEMIDKMMVLIKNGVIENPLKNEKRNT